MSLFCFGNRKKLQGAKSGECGVVLGQKIMEQTMMSELAVTNNRQAHENMSNLVYLPKTKWLTMSTYVVDVYTKK